MTTVLNWMAMRNKLKNMKQHWVPNREIALGCLQIKMNLKQEWVILTNK